MSEGLKTMETLRARTEIKSGQPFEFKTPEDAEEYLEWKQEVPESFRRVVEASIKNTPYERNVGLPLVDEFLHGFADRLNVSEIEQKELAESGHDRRVQNLLDPLGHIETEGGYINAFEMFRNPDVSWKLKKRLYEMQVKQALEWLASKDLETVEEEEQQADAEGEAKKESGKEAEEYETPPDSEEVISSMEAGAEEKEKGKARALFRVFPFYGGYYDQQIFHTFNIETGKWGKDENIFEKPDRAELDPASMREMRGTVRGGKPLAIALPEHWAIDVGNIECSAKAGAYEVVRNSEGLWYFRVKGTGVADYRLRIGKRLRAEERGKPKKGEIQGSIAKEMQEKIKELKSKNLPEIKLAREIIKFIRANLTYSNSRAAWEEYHASGNTLFETLWQRKEADCFWANTLAIRALKEAGIDAWFLAGHFVKEKDEKGNAVLHSGNGHARLAVWDSVSQKLVRLDATPKGDPTVDEETQERDLEGGEGDYGEQDEVASEKQAKEQLKKMGGAGGGGKKERKSPAFDMAESQFSELAECTPSQAREFLRALERVREIKDETGESIVELLKNEWRKIVEERKIEKREYKGPVRMSEGSRLDDVVEARLDIRAREFNPTGFERDEIHEKRQTEFGGINIYFSFDLSGSMSGTDGASGRSKADVQRDAALMLVDALMQCAVIHRRDEADTDLLPIKIMVTLASDTGEVTLHLTDRWGPKEQWAFYSALTRLASGGTPTHETLTLIERDFDEEVADLKKKQVQEHDLPIHYVAEISDGAPDDFAATEAMHEKLKKKGAALRSYVIGGMSESIDAAPPLESFAELPRIVSRDIITLFKKLRPRKIT